MSQSEVWLIRLSDTDELEDWAWFLAKGVVTAVQIFKVAQESPFIHLPSCSAGVHLGAARDEAALKKMDVSRKAYVFRRPRPKLESLLCHLSIFPERKVAIL